MLKENSIHCPKFPQEIEIHDRLSESQWIFRLKHPMKNLNLAKIAKSLSEEAVEVSLSSDDFQTFGMTVRSRFKPLTHEWLFSRMRLVSKLHWRLGALERLQSQDADVWKGAFQDSWLTAKPKTGSAS
jgi:hypothetical protein